jgi:hypothetical protein
MKTKKHFFTGKFQIKLFALFLTYFAIQLIFR